MTSLPQVEGVGVDTLSQGDGPLFSGVTLPAAVRAAGVLDHHAGHLGRLAVDPCLDLGGQFWVVEQPLFLTRGGDDPWRPEVTEDLDQRAPVPGPPIPAGPDSLGDREVQERELLEFSPHQHGAARLDAVATDVGHEVDHGRRLVGTGQHVNRFAAVNVHVLARELQHGIEQLRFGRQEFLREEHPVGVQSQLERHGDQGVVSPGVSGGDHGVAN